jgi:hypothetical protein
LDERLEKKMAEERVDMLVYWMADSMVVKWVGD